MLGNIIKLYLNDEPVMAATSCSVTLNQQAEEYTPLPGTTDDDGWKHYNCGKLSWSVSHDGLMSSANNELIGKITSGVNKFLAQIDISEGGDMLEGDVSLSEVSVVANVNSLAKISAKLVCDDFPKIV